MELIGTWFITAISPLGKETYNLRLNSDGSGSISHDRGTVEFSDAIVESGEDFIILKISGRTEIPISTDFVCGCVLSGKSLDGFVQIGEYAKIDIKGIQI
jgi:hypothetical protein